MGSICKGVRIAIPSKRTRCVAKGRTKGVVCCYVLCSMCVEVCG